MLLGAWLSSFLLWLFVGANGCSVRAEEDALSSCSSGMVLPVGALDYAATVENQSPRWRAFPDVASRRAAVKEAALHAWRGYETFAWGTDELRPRSQRGEDTFGGLGTTIVDSLSTLYVMGLMDEFNAGRNWVHNGLNFERVGEVIVFETVIRILGGLLSAYHLSGDEMFLAKSEDLGRRLAKCFETKTGLPFPRCELNSSECMFHREYGRNVLLAEVGTLQLEFRALSFHTPDPVLRSLRDRVEDVVRLLDSITPQQNLGLIPFLLSIDTGHFMNQHITLGSPSDSYFEYILKLWIQGGRQEGFYRDKFVKLMEGIMTYMTVTFDDGRTVVTEITGSTMEFSKMDHFTCYLPGIVVLGLDATLDQEQRDEWLALAANITRTCYGMYDWTASGLSAENIEVSTDGHVSFNGGHLLRPEVVEALFYMWRHTHEEIYRDMSWTIFQRIQKWCRTADAYTVLETAHHSNPPQGDLQPSFFLAETLKYLYLTFSSDDVLPLDKWVFNTEGHPLLIMPGLSTT